MAESKPDSTAKSASPPDELVKDLDSTHLDVERSEAEQTEIRGGKMTIKFAPETTQFKK